MPLINRDVAEHFAKTEDIYIITIIKFPACNYTIEPCSFAIKVPVDSAFDIVQLYDKVYDLLMERYLGEKHMIYLHAYYSIDENEKQKRDMRNYWLCQ